MAAEYILAHILSCGTEDLTMLDDIGYDVTEIISNIPHENISFESIIKHVVKKANEDLRKAWKAEKENIISEIQEQKNGMITLMKKDGYSETDIDDIDEVKDLEHDEQFAINNADAIIKNGISMSFNYLDTHLYLKNADFFERYLKAYWDNIIDNIGFQYIESV